ncbi:hypothetical protein ACFP3I_01185 [Chryseobacterium arachidis]|uniref:hypothetical protein n=1 Tax=Chryseobacterium arachidis TaxID=1416778 RepID=UPI00361D4DAB
MQIIFIILLLVIVRRELIQQSHPTFIFNLFFRSCFPLSTVSFWLRLPLRSSRNQKGCRFNRG